MLPDFASSNSSSISFEGFFVRSETTTMKMLSTLLSPTSGDAILLGSSIVTDAQRVKPFLAVSPQETAVAMNLTVRENLALMAGIYGADKNASLAAVAISTIACVFTIPLMLWITKAVIGV